MPHIMQSAGAGRAGRVSTLVDSCLIGDSIVTSDEGAGPGGGAAKVALGFGEARTGQWPGIATCCPGALRRTPLACRL